MSSLFEMISLKDQKRVLVLNTPDHFQHDIDEKIKQGLTIDDERMPSAEYDFALTFISSTDEIGVEAYMISKSLTKTKPILWIGYSKSADISMEEAIEIMASMNFVKVEEVQLDSEWSAMRFEKS